MKTYKITFDQFVAIESASGLAQYFIDDQEPSNPQHESDIDTLNVAFEALKQIYKPE